MREARGLWGGLAGSILLNPRVDLLELAPVFLGVFSAPSMVLEREGVDETTQQTHQTKERNKRKRTFFFFFWIERKGKAKGGDDQRDARPGQGRWPGLKN